MQKNQPTDLIRPDTPTLHWRHHHAHIFLGQFEHIEKFQSKHQRTHERASFSLNHMTTTMTTKISPSIQI
jgi:hypothetical protein